MTRKKYCLYDFYERYGVVAECDTLREIRQAWTSWMAETEGKCKLMILLWDENLLGFRPFPGSVTMEERR